jgi:predicted heme/steroid binding protein
MREFTLQELSQYDGKQGRPAYIACHGKVYNVTASFLWKYGRHEVVHRAGNDLTDELTEAPHGLDMLDKIEVVGSLVKGPAR